MKKLSKVLLSSVILSSLVVSNPSMKINAEVVHDDFSNDVVNNITFKDSISGQELTKTTFKGNVFDSRLNDFVKKLNTDNNAHFEIEKKQITSSTTATSNFLGNIVSKTTNQYVVYLKDSISSTPIKIKPNFLPDGIIYDNSNIKRASNKITVTYKDKVLYSDEYIDTNTIDARIRSAMSNVDKSKYYFDSVNVSSGFTWSNIFMGDLNEINIIVKSYDDFNKPAEIVSTEKPTTEKPTTEKPTTEKPTTERPTTEQPTTEKPSVQVPTTEVPTTEVVSTEKPTIEKPQSIVVSKPVISNKYIGDNTSIITGKAKSYSTVYALVNKKVIGSAKVKNGKFTMKIAKQTAGTKISFYTNYKKKKSSTVTYTIADKTAPTYPIVNKVTYKSKVVTGKGEKSSKVYVYNGKNKIGYSVVDSKGNYKVKISAQKQKTILTVYLVDKAGNKGKAKSIKVS
ncbi:Ig-like domain-containing protein [Macrococcoides goetzii]|uniref:Ig-like domain-containing protein n=1 Tax=Macrococcus TaxID=69965 RepID=UPI001EF24ABA|nr:MULTISPECIES: Ig-like domain-containing protein [Macrococcus]MCG7421139.1 Ig-like domain-containing protein [Macrococcus epidermidis]MCH4984458.1 hypothetical protein [Macrococcus sp. PK]